MEKLVYGVNGLVLFLIARYEYGSDSDKTIIISSLAFFSLVTLNLLLGFITQLDKKAIHKHFYFSALGLFIGALILLSIW